ncbi:hypothetical protein [Streptomyces turgidiscabies]|uniref:hypothetical protein n=1 Tax=Streptomyces turgidiscabies TaxID=85558 RepID=UPI0038F683C7
MGQKIIRFSDLSGKHIENDEDVVRIVITQHPELEGGPVEIEALADELSDVDENSLDLVTFELHFPGEEEAETIVMEVEPFNKLAADSPMSEVLKAAKKVTRGAVPSQSRPASAQAKVNYATLEHAGKPKKGKTSEEEKQIVRDNFDQINERLKAEGLRTIDLDNPDHVSRYGLEELAAERAKAKK